jgi:hypothetical protein
MKTSELYIEQVLIGLLVVAIAVIPWAPELVPKLGEIGTARAIAEASVLLGLAFWLGIPFDRFADTLSERLERHNRLQYALNVATDKDVPAQKPAPNDSTLVRDVYPEDRLRLAAMREEEAVVSWIHYHRSRIRLARALGVYGPALTLSMTLGVARWNGVFQASAVGLFLVCGIAAAYLLWALIASPPKPLRRKARTSRVLRVLFGGRNLPRTDHIKFIDYANEWGRIEGARFVEGNYSDFRVWLCEWRIIAIPVLLLLSAFWLGLATGIIISAVAATGALLTLIATWSWWRISFTFRSYLRDLDPTSSRT